MISGISTLLIRSWVDMIYTAEAELPPCLDDVTFKTLDLGA